MRCDYCNKKIKENQSYEVTAPDGDHFHEKCLAKHEAKRDKFFNETIHDDSKFAKWLGDSESIS